MFCEFVVIVIYLEQRLTDLRLICQQYGCLSNCNDVLQEYNSTTFTGDCITIVDPKTSDAESTRRLRHNDVNLASFNGMLSVCVIFSQ